MSNWANHGRKPCQRPFDVSHSPYGLVVESSQLTPPADVEAVSPGGASATARAAGTSEHRSDYYSGETSINDPHFTNKLQIIFQATLRFTTHFTIVFHSVSFDST